MTALPAIKGETTVKLGEALSLRAKQAQKLNDIRGRIKANALVQEGTTPAENADELVSEYLILSAEHSDLLYRIATTNATTMRAGESLTHLLQRREDLIRARNIYGSTADAASPSRDSMRYMRSELAYVPTVDVAAYRRNEDQTNDEVRKLDAAIQELNWRIELL